jgi:Cu(I)/Ag(I) efflux system membrane fusion protein
MKNKLVPAVTFIAAIAIGVLLGQWWNGDSATVSPSNGEREVLYWVAPMDPDYRRDEPGKSPMGMDLVPVYADEVDREVGVVKIDPTVVNNLGVRTEPAERGPLSRRIETVAYVVYDEDTMQHVHTRVEGWIENLAARATGDTVEEGQLLFELYSPTLVNAQQEYLAALRSNNSALRNASRERLSALGVSAGEIERLEQERTGRQRVRVYAQTDGVIDHLGAREGMYVTPATEVMAVANPGKIWVIAEVLERQAHWVEPGQAATVRLDNAPGRTWQGTVDYVYPELDPVARTLRVRLRFDNADGVFRPNMFASVTILGESTADLVHVPREAVIRGGSVDRVVVALGQGRFRAQPVKIGIESGDRVAILDGVAAGDTIVVSAQFLIDSEANIEAALSKLGDSTTESRDGDHQHHHHMEPSP